MDIFLNKEKLGYIKNVFSATLPQEETMEMIVPDAMPDIERIVDTDANVFLRSKSTDSGRIMVTGVADVTVLYCPEGEMGVRKMTLEIPFTSAATENEITQATRVTTSVTLAGADAAMVNPRKIVARVNMLIDVACYNDAEMLVAAGMDEDTDAGIELLTDNTEVMTTTNVKEKTFVITDELAMPASNPPIGEILKYKASLAPEDVKVVGSKLILRGTVSVSLLYTTPEDADVIRGDFSSEFSQIIELDDQAGEGSYTIIPMLTNAYFDTELSPGAPDGKVIVMELHAVAQCVITEKKQIAYISDMYSTKYRLEEEMTAYPFDQMRTIKANTVLHGMLDTTEPVARVVAVNVHTGPVDTTSSEDVSASMKAPVTVSALYVTEDGQLMSNAETYQVEAEAEADPSANNIASAASGKDVYAVAVTGGIELRVPVEFTVTENAIQQIRTLDKLSYDEASPIDMAKAPSVTVTRIAPGDTLWHLAKSHGSTSKLILSANGYNEEDEVNAGQLLIIPKKR